MRLSIGRLRWRRKKQTGDYRAAEAHELTREGQRLATVQRTAGGWFWYGMQKNTALAPPIPDLDAAKKQCEEYVRERLKSLAAREEW